ncbi:MAG TPA: hypothetical protein PKE47_17675, partial [Verrucomicrobiota bacterium]|nr:hypothetical protein [Verrucomicrobiota bacterium]
MPIGTVAMNANEVPQPAPPGRGLQPPLTPAGPSEPWLDPVKEWAARRQADLLLYLGAFMLSISALIFVSQQGGVIDGLARSVLLAIYTAAFLVFGTFLRRWERVQEAGPVFVGIGALLTPLNFLNLYASVLREDGVPQEWIWLIGSSSTAALYATLGFRDFGRPYFIPAAAAAGVAWGSLAATFGLPLSWWGPWFMAPAVGLVVVGWRQYQERMAWFEAAAGAIALPALIAAHVFSVIDDPSFAERLALPATYAGLLAALGLPAFAMRRRH